MSLRSTLTRLFRTFTGRRPLTQREVAADEIERRLRVRNRTPLDAACRANHLTKAERSRVFRAFEEMAPRAGMSAARDYARNLAASIGGHRTGAPKSADPWDRNPPPAAA